MNNSNQFADTTRYHYISISITKICGFDARRYVNLAHDYEIRSIHIACGDYRRFTCDSSNSYALGVASTDRRWCSGESRRGEECHRHEHSIAFAGTTSRSESRDYA
jgi:hypothetical protein